MRFVWKTVHRRRWEKTNRTSETSLISKAFFFLERSAGRTAEPTAGQKAQQFKEEKADGS